MSISRPKSKKLVLDSMQIQMSTSMEYFISGIKNEKTVAVQKSNIITNWIMVIQYLKKIYQIQ